MKRECRPWCGTGDYGSLLHQAYYSRKGRFYCRYRCMRSAAKAEQQANAKRDGGAAASDGRGT